MSVDFATSWRVGAHYPRTTQTKLRAMVRGKILDLRAAFPPPLRETFLTPIFCHYVFDDQREAFAAMLAHLQTLGSFVDTDTCLSMVKGERPIDGRYFHLSFDDGLKNMLTNAAPIMRDAGVPGIVFANSALASATPEEQAEHCRTVTRYPAPVEHMNWDEIKRLRDMGVEIGAHTRRHPRLSDISNDAAQLEDEVLGCKTDLESQLGEPCRHFAWPYGKPSDIDDAAQAAVRSAGFESNFGMIRRPVIPGETSRFEIPRHHFELQWPLKHIAFFARGGMETKAA